MRGRGSPRFGPPIADLTRCPIIGFTRCSENPYTIILHIDIGYDKKAARTLDLKSPAHTCSPLYTHAAHMYAADVVTQIAVSGPVSFRLRESYEWSRVEWTGKVRQ
jgi:hypothetical protein